MISELRTEAIVQSGGLVQIRSDELPEGATVKVILIMKIPQPEEARTKNLVNFIGATRGKGSFFGVEDIDAYIREERDSWDS